MDKPPHDGLVLFVAARIGDFQHLQRQIGGLGLKLQQPQADRVHGHPLVLAVDGREQPRQFDFRILPQDVQGPGAILAAAPTQKGAFFHLVACQFLHRFYRPVNAYPWHCIICYAESKFSKR